MQKIVCTATQISVAVWCSFERDFKLKMVNSTKVIIQMQHIFISDPY